MSREAVRDPAAFRCIECGDCCRRHRVPLTVADLRRLAQAVTDPPSSLVDWLAPSEVDMTGEPESFVELPHGKRLPVLAFHAGACRFLDAAKRCALYGARPACCRTFPLEWLDAGRRRLTLLENAECPGEFDVAPDPALHRARLAARRAELIEHVSFVAEWNRHQRWRRRAGHRLRPAPAFLERALY